MSRLPPEVLSDLVDLLARCPAFEGVPRDRLLGLARGSAVAYLALAEEPATEALVVMRGEVRLLDPDGDVVDVADAGEYAAPAPGSRVEPVSSALVVWLPEDARAVAWTAARDPGWRPPEQDAARVDLHATPLRSVMSSPVLTVAPDSSCRDAAVAMREARVSSVLVHRGGEVGILTDRDLRSRLVAEGLSADTAVEVVATVPARTVGAEVTCFEGLLEMLTHGVHHLPVVEGGRVVGMVTSTDLQVLDSRSPMRVRAALSRAGSVEEAAAALADLPASVSALLAGGSGPHEVGRVVATVTDQVQQRLLALAFEVLGRPEGEFGWLCFGSQARREQTLLTDQDTGLVVPAGVGEETSEHWRAVAAWVVDALERCGYPRCRGGVMASEPAWRHDLAGWHALLDGLVHRPTPHHLLESAIAFDLRFVAGRVTHADVLGPALEAAAGHDLFRAHLARVATSHRPPLGFLGRLTVERGGEHGGQLDLKKGALLPIADLARMTTVARGGVETGTDERLAAAAETGVMSHELAGTLRAGYTLALGLRLQRHADLFAEGRTLSNHLDPDTLDPWVRSQLRETFKAVRLAQEHLQSRYLTGMLG